MIPGSNILKQALTLIAAQSIVYLAYVSRSLNEVGLLVPIYADPVTIRGSLQPVSQSLMQTLGLDMQRRYVKIFVPNSVVDITRDVSSDKFQFAGVIYQATSITQWIADDGWNEVMAVAVPS